MKIKNYEITYKEEGAIPLFYSLNKNENLLIIGSSAVGSSANPGGSIPRWRGYG